MFSLFRAAPFAAACLAFCQIATPAQAQVLAQPQVLAQSQMLAPAAPAMAAPAVSSPAVATPDAPTINLGALVASFVPEPSQDEASECLAKAVYFEARGESLQGQLAVAEVVLNRAASGVYPADVCGVITQKAQFSFIRNGAFPAPDMASASWHKAIAIAHIARTNLVRAVAPGVMWYHANYVSPSWSRFHSQVARIGAHIFYA